MTADPRLAPVHDALRRLDAAGQRVTEAETRYRAALDRHRTGHAVVQAGLAVTEARRDLASAAVEAHQSGAITAAARVVAGARIREGGEA